MASSPQTNTPVEAPEYELNRQAFFEPERYEAGTRIIYHGVPGDHMVPLNDAARAKMEEFYEAEFPELDPKTGEKTGRMIKPRQILRPAPYIGAEAHAVTVTAMPAEPALHAHVSTLAEMAVSKRATNQRPGPAHVPTPVPVPTPEAKDG